MAQSLAVPGRPVRLLLAQGFGIGRIPFAPGTFGSLLGLGWFALLLLGASPWLLALGTAFGFAVSVWLCGLGERVLGTKDPGSVVLDEVTAMPLCFFAWTAIVLERTGALPGCGYFVAHWGWSLGVFAAFRVFDVTKPWPVHQSQALPGGWGITLDDFLAALYVNLLTLLIFAILVMLGKTGTA